MMKETTSPQNADLQDGVVSRYSPSGGAIVASDDKVREEWLWNFHIHPIIPITIQSAR